MDVTKHAIRYGLAAAMIFTGCQSSKDTGSAPLNVEVQKVAVADEHQDFAYSGTIEEAETIPLSFSSVGTVAHVYVSEGAAVKKGQLLADLDNATFRNSYEMAKAMEDRAEDAYKRLKPMHDNGNLSDVKFVEVETGLQQAKASAAIARKSMEDCRLYATSDGWVGKRSIDPGMVAMPNISSLTIVKIQKVFARVSVSEQEIARMKKGAAATVTVGALGADFQGTVEEIGVVADQIARTYKVKIGVQNKNYDIKPGMICTVSIKTSGGVRGIVVPNRAVLVDETGKNFVYTVDPEQKKAVRKSVVVKNLLASGIEISDGLQAGELVVTSGQQKLVDHASVSMVGQQVK
jgi:RND family efflux transporter MFP subunit